MRLEILDSKNPSYNPNRWCEIEAIAKGGNRFQNHLTKFLPMNPVEPDDVYSQRTREAHLTSYMGSIINLYVSWLFAAKFNAKASKKGTKDAIQTLPSFYGDFQEDVSSETTLSSFMKERFRAMLETGESFWLIELPDNGGVAPDNAKDFESRGLGRATLKALERSEILDWECDELGAFKWVNVHTVVETRESWMAKRDLVVETWRIYEAEVVHTFQLRYKKGERPNKPNLEVPQIGDPAPHGFHRVPVVKMSVPVELCIGEQTFDPQLEHFRVDNALSWLIRRTCYAQPIFMLEDGDRLPTMGTGYGIAMGPNDKMGWTAPPTAPFDILQGKLDSKREEIYRIVHQMAQAVDNNAETVGRSADSKEIDAAATRILLNAYGEYVSKSIEETLEIISEARGDNEYEWSVEGFSGYDTATLSSLIANAKEILALNIPSPTLRREVAQKVALATLPEVDDKVKTAIRSELAADPFDSPTVEARALEASAKLDEAKAAAEPVKAKAAMKSASQPKPAAPGKPAAPKAKPASAK